MRVFFVLIFSLNSHKTTGELDPSRGNLPDATGAIVKTETGEQLPNDSASVGGKIGPVRPSSPQPLGRKTESTRGQFEEAQWERGDVSSTETSSAGGRYGGDALVADMHMSIGDPVDGGSR